MYKFYPRGEPVSVSFRAIALSQLEAVLGDLDKPGADVGMLVHNSRRRCKKLRGLLRLVRPGFAGFVQENAAIRDAAAMLSHLRDTDILRQTIAKLADHAETDAARLRAIAAQLDTNALGDPTERLREFEAALGVVRDRARHWSVNHDGFDTLIAGLEAAYRTGRRRLRRAGKTRSPVDLHDWRKSSKYHGHHVDLLRRTEPHILAEELKVIEGLSTRLGDHHDLVVLHEAMRNSPERFGDPIDRAALGAAIAARRGTIEKHALKLGRQIFAERPGALAERYRAYWRAAA